VAYWLVKSEPTEYSYADLERDAKTQWSGIHNPTALLHLRAMRPGDELLFYHSGGERAVVGVARVASGPRPDRSDARRSWTLEVRPVRPLPRPVGLAELRAEPALRDFILFRISRLSVLPVTAAQWKRIIARSATSPPVQGRKPGSRSSSRAAAPRKRGST